MTVSPDFFADAPRVADERTIGCTADAPLVGRDLSGLRIQRALVRHRIGNRAERSRIADDAISGPCDRVSLRDPRPRASANGNPGAGRDRSRISRYFSYERQTPPWQ